MTHFDIARWTDYVRGLVPAADQELMGRHLAGGCEQCRATVALLVRVQQEATAEPNVPEHLVTAAKAVFQPAAAFQLAGWMAFPRLAAKRIFDGLAAPALEGARSAAAAESRIVYRAGDYSIDLQMERDPESSELALIGQLEDRSMSPVPLAGVPVVLTAGARVLARGESNRFGEFCLAGRAVRGLTLRVPLESRGKQVVISLKGFLEAEQ